MNMPKGMRNKYKRLLMFVLAPMAIACAPFLAWGSSFNAFPPLLKGLKDIAISKDGTIFALRKAPPPFKQVWVFDSNGDFQDKWGEGLKGVTSIAINSRGRVYIVNRGPGKRRRISIFDPELDGYQFKRNLDRLGAMALGKNLRIAIGPSDSIVAIDRDVSRRGSAMAIADGEGRVKNFIRYPQFDFVDVITDGTGVIYAFDARKSKIVQFDSRGALVGAIGERLESPAAVATGEGGSFYVLNKKTFKLQRIARGAEISSWGGKGSGPAEFAKPTALAAGWDRVYVADDGSIKIFDESGRFILKIGGSESLVGPRGLCRDYDGNIYVADAKLGRVEKFDAEGDQLSSIGQGVLRKPMVVAERNGEIFVLDGGALKLFAFFLDGSNAAWDLPATLTKLRIADIRMTPDGDFALVMERDSFSLNAKIWKVDTRTGAFEEIPQLSSLGRPVIGLSEDGTVFVVNAQGSGIDIFDVTGTRVSGFPSEGGSSGINFIRPSFVAQGLGDVLYVVDHVGRVSSIRRLDLESGQVTDQWNGWGVSPELPFGNVVGMIVNYDGSLVISDAFWGVVLHLVEDGQGKLIPAGAVELPLFEMVTKRPEKRARPKPTIEEVETEEVPKSKKIRYVVAVLTVLCILFIVSVLRRRRRR
jgi:DNA-binding beta-propeller fold protein YncE